MTRAFVGLGSNLGNRLEYLRAAVASIEDCAAVSGVYETDPVGGPEQDKYLNVVVELNTDMSARKLLEMSQRLEVAAERVRTVRWGARTLDADVLWVDGETVNDPDLVVPHPRMFERAFVMLPLAELAPDLAEGWHDPGTGGWQRLGDWSAVASGEAVTAKTSS